MMKKNIERTSFGSQKGHDAMLATPVQAKQIFA
jgi:hypothetical protein